MQYDGDVARAKDVLKNLDEFYPGATGYEVAGFLWWQGDKDRYNAGHAIKYEQNLVNLIAALRKDFDAPKAKFVCATLGQTNKEKAEGNEKLILDAMFAAANTGESGGTSTSFLAGNVVSLDEGGTNSNLNVPKLRAAKRLLMSHDVDLDNDPLYCVVDSVNHDALLNEIQIVSSDYNGADMPVLKEGKVTRFLGINFIHTELSIAASRLGTDDQTTSTTSKQLPVYTKSGLHMGIWGDISSSVTTRNDLQGEPWQAYVKQTVGATRVEEKRVVKIWCAA